jgi:hypothetical protein
VSVGLPGLAGSAAADVQTKLMADNPNATTVSLTGSGTNPNHRVFLYAGTYGTGIALNAGGWLIGHG